jgi:uncharacterized protein (DUF1800 family)
MSSRIVRESSFNLTEDRDRIRQTGRLQSQAGLRTRQILSAFALAALSIAAAGCSGVVNQASTASSPTSPSGDAISVSISGSSQVRLGGTVQFTAAVANTSNTAVTWQVNGVSGGAAATGTITSAGLYTPPSSIPNPNTVSVEAVSSASSTASASLTESILNPVPVVTSASISGVAPSFFVIVTGSGFVSGSQIQVQGTAETTTFVSATQLTTSLSMTPSAGTTSLSVVVTNPNPGTDSSSSLSAQLPSAPVVTSPSSGAATATLAAAARLLDQATFGPTPAAIQHVESVGLAAYLNEQFALPPSTLPVIALTPATTCSSNVTACMQSEWWQAALTAPDQLRQRVAFALSEMYVVSNDAVNAQAVLTFQNILVNDAFGNFSTIMHEVTTSSAMGIYLNMLNSAKPTSGQIANENYAREAMQLFSLGTSMLNQDGTLQLDANGNPIPVYTGAQVQAFARAYTGWTAAPLTAGATPPFPNWTANYTSPMVAVESEHDETAKTLLNGAVLPAGQTAEEDLSGALQNVFEHPNVGPFVCRQLIQHLVTGNPSPAYVSRVAAVFADDGNGVRGNMQAVVAAVLMDQEARAGDTNPADDGGHLREPVLWLADVLRGLGATNNDAVAGNDVVANASYSSMGSYSSQLGQEPYYASSVFNFFPPGYVIPGTTENAPEFGIENTASVVLRLSRANAIVMNRLTNFNIDLSATGTFGTLAANPGNLVDTLGLIFMHGQMSTNMRSEIINSITPITDMGERARVAVYLVITSSQYKTEH